MIWVRHIFKHQCEVHWEVPDEVITGPSWLIQFGQTCTKNMIMRPFAVCGKGAVSSNWCGVLIKLNH